MFKLSAHFFLSIIKALPQFFWNIVYRLWGGLINYCLVPLFKPSIVLYISNNPHKTHFSLQFRLQKTLFPRSKILVIHYSLYSLYFSILLRESHSDEIRPMSLIQIFSSLTCSLRVYHWSASIFLPLEETPCSPGLLYQDLWTLEFFARECFPFFTQPSNPVLTLTSLNTIAFRWFHKNKIKLK